MTTIAGRTGRPFHIVRRVIGFPPIRPFGDKIWLPCVIDNVPLRRLGEIVVADFSEVALLPNAAVNECHLVFRKFGDRVGSKIRNTSVRGISDMPVSLHSALRSN